MRVDCIVMKGRPPPRSGAALQRFITAYERAIRQAQLIGWPALEDSFRKSLADVAAGARENPPDTTRKAPAARAPRPART